MIEAGKINTRITIQTVSHRVTPNAYGEFPKGGDVWTEATEWWAEVRPLKVDERMIGERTEAVATHELRMRYYDGLKHNDRITIKHSGQILYVVAIRDLYAAERVHMVTCKEWADRDES